MTRRRLTPARVTLALTALLLAAAGAAWSERLPLAKWAALRAIERQGLGPATLALDEVGPSGLRAHDVTLRGGALRLASLSAAYAPLALAAGRLDRLELGGLELALDLGAIGVSLGGKPLGGAGTGGGLPRLRIDAIALPDARLRLTTGAGTVEATLSATLALDGGVLKASDIAADITVPVAGSRRAAHVAARGVRVAPGVAGSPLLSVTQAAVTPDGLPWVMTGIDGTLSAWDNRLAAAVDVAELTNRQQPPLVTPLRVAATESLGGAGAEIALDVATVAPSPLLLQAKARYDRSSAGGSATLAMAPLVFHRGSLQPQALFPVLAGLARDVDGTVRLDGSIGWRDGRLSPKLRLRLGDLAFSTDAAQIRALSGDIAFSELWPPATAPHQTLTATIEAPGLPSAQLSLRGQVTGKPALAVERLALAVAGGEIAAGPFTVAPGALRLDTDLRVAHVDIAALTALLSIDGLGGTGALDGDVPLHFAGGKLAVNNGKLAASAPGVLRYQPQHLPQQIAAAGESVDLALRVLSDFRYDRLSLALDKSAEGEGSVLLHLEGRNPAVMSGQAFNFNIRVDTNFDRLADYALLSLRSAEELLRRAAGRSGP
jgi:hypothetical protein